MRITGGVLSVGDGLEEDIYWRKTVHRAPK